MSAAPEHVIIDGQRVPLTPWFPGHVNPVHPGVYEIQALYGFWRGSLYRGWDGERWHLGAPLIAQAENRLARGTPILAEFEPMPWRGLAEPPGAV